MPMPSSVVRRAAIASDEKRSVPDNRKTSALNFDASPVMVIPPITRPAAAQAPATGTVRKLVSASMS